jgi:hypothetical protein
MIAKITTGGIVLKYLTGTTRGIVVQLILGCNFSFIKEKKILKYHNFNTNPNPPVEIML